MFGLKPREKLISGAKNAVLWWYTPPTLSLNQFLYDQNLTSRAKPKKKNKKQKQNFSTFLISNRIRLNPRDLKKKSTLLIPNRVWCIFRTYSVYKLHSSHKNCRIRVYAVLVFSKLHHNENHDHNFYIWSFNFLEIFFIKDTDADCNVITYRTSILFLF